MERQNMYKINWNKIRKKYGLCNDDLPEKFNKKIKQLNKIIKYYLPGTRKRKIILKEEEILKSNNSILKLGDSSTILKLTTNFSMKMQEFKKINPEIQDLPDNRIYNQICYGLLCGEILNRFGNKLNCENYDTLVLWLRDAALIPTEKRVKTLLVGESSDTKNNMYYQIKEFINTHIKKGNTIDHEMMKEYLKDNEINKDLENFNKFISENIEGKVAFVDTGFSGAQQERTKIQIGNENIDIVLGFKEEPIKYAKELGLKRQEIHIIENMDKPIVSFQRFNTVKDIINANFEHFDNNNKETIIENILEDLDNTILQHLGFEMYQKEKINDRKIKKLYKDEII